MLMFAFLDILRSQILAVEIHLHGAYLACSYPGPCTPLDKTADKIFFPIFYVEALVFGSNSSCRMRRYLANCQRDKLYTLPLDGRHNLKQVQQKPVVLISGRQPVSRCYSYQW